MSIDITHIYIYQAYTKACTTMDINGPMEDFSLTEHKQLIAKMSGKPIILRAAPKKEDMEIKKTPSVEKKKENVVVCRLPPFRRIARLIKALLDMNNKYQVGIPEGVRLCQAPMLWESGLRGEGVLVAVVDSGISYHDDLVGKVVESRSFVRDIFNHSHGTHVAGTIAANGNIVGVAPDAKLVDVKVLNSLGAGSEASTAMGLSWISELNASGRNIQVVNLSLGSTQSSPLIREEINKLTESGVLVVCASGNNGDGLEYTDELNYPAADSECTSVGACDREGQVAMFSSSNNELDVVALGVEVISCVPGFQSYETWNGTSMAAPHVSGVAALVFEHLNKYKMTPQERLKHVTRILYKVFAKDVDRPGVDSNTGYGMVVCRPIEEWRLGDDLDLIRNIGGKRPEPL